MASSGNTINMTIRIDKDFKTEIDNLFRNLGINTTSAIMMFLKQCSREKGLPFTATMDVPNKRLLEAIKEADMIEKDPNRKGHSSRESLVKALEDEL